jgi:DNA-binding IclR family transcriptional regulator
MGLIKGALHSDTVQLARRVWALLTKNPQLVLPELAAQTGATKSQCYYALKLLIRQGYVQRPRKNVRRAIRVLVPFGVCE